MFAVANLSIAGASDFATAVLPSNVAKGGDTMTGALVVQPGGAGVPLTLRPFGATDIGQIIKLASAASGHALEVNSSSGSGGDRAYLSAAGGAFLAGPLGVGGTTPTTGAEVGVVGNQQVLRLWDRSGGGRRYSSIIVHPTLQLWSDVNDGSDSRQLATLDGSTGYIRTFGKLGVNTAVDATTSQLRVATASDSTPGINIQIGNTQTANPFNVSKTALGDTFFIDNMGNCQSNGYDSTGGATLAASPRRTAGDVIGVVGNGTPLWMIDRSGGGREFYFKILAAAIQFRSDVNDGTDDRLLWSADGATGRMSFTDSVGFNGVAPIAQPVLATGAGHTVDDVITLLQSFGMVRQS